MGARRKLQRRQTGGSVKEQRRQEAIRAEREMEAARIERQKEVYAEARSVMTFYKMTVLTAWTLHSKFGFGRERLQRFQDEMARWMTTLQCDAIDGNLDDMNDTLKEETGFDALWDADHRCYNRDGEVMSALSTITGGR